MDLEQFNKYSPIVAIILCFLLDLIIITTSYWPLNLFPAIIGGLFCVEMKWGAVSGALGIIFAWLLASIFSMNDLYLQADQLGQLLTDSSGVGIVIILLIFTIGALFGFLGGSIGSGIRILVFPVIDEVTE